MDQAGKLTPEEREKIRDWLVAHQAKLACPICHNQQWSVADMLVVAPQVVRGGINISAGIPLVTVFCTRCTFVRFHSAVAMGLLPVEESKGATVG